MGFRHCTVGGQEQTSPEMKCFKGVNFRKILNVCMEELVEGTERMVGLFSHCQVFLYSSILLPKYILQKYELWQRGVPS